MKVVRTRDPGETDKRPGGLEIARLLLQAAQTVLLFVRFLGD